MYGGFGLNIFEDADDGEIDQLLLRVTSMPTTGSMTKMAIVQMVRRQTRLVS